MDEEWFQQMEKRLNEQLEATRAMNETLNKFLAVMANQEATQNVAPLPLASPPPVTTPPKVSHPSRVNPGTPSNFNGDRAQGHTFLMSCELYISLSQADLLRTKCASIGHCPTSRADVWRPSLNKLYDRRCEAERCASHLGTNSEMNSWRRSVQRTRRLQHSCDWSWTDTSRAKGM
jgi:hypothetical protein